MSCRRQESLSGRYTRDGRGQARRHGAHNTRGSQMWEDEARGVAESADDGAPAWGAAWSCSLATARTSRTLCRHGCRHLALQSGSPRRGDRVAVLQRRTPAAAAPAASSLVVSTASVSQLQLRFLTGPSPQPAALQPPSAPCRRRTGSACPATRGGSPVASGAVRFVGWVGQRAGMRHAHRGAAWKAAAADGSSGAGSPFRNRCRHLRICRSAAVRRGGRGHSPPGCSGGHSARLKHAAQSGPGGRGPKSGSAAPAAGSCSPWG